MIRREMRHSLFFALLFLDNPDYLHYICPMKFLGNIITDSKFDGNGLYNVVHSIDDCIDDIPILIIGWNKVKSIYPDADILEWEIKDNVYWTFGKRERNWRYEDDVERFKKLCLEYVVKDIRYSFFNILTANNEEKYIFTAWITEPNHKKYVYLKNNMAYIYIEGKNIVYGISLRDIDYEAGNHEKFMRMLNTTKSVTMVKPDSEIYQIRMLTISTPYVVPYLYSD